MKDLLLYFKTECECGKIIEVAKNLTGQLLMLKEHTVTCPCGNKIFAHVQAIKPLAKAS